MRLSIGEKAEFTKTISESDIYLFAGITGDMNPIHINCEMASKSFAGNRIAHGGLIEGLISAVIGMYLPGPGTIYMEQNSKFIAPVFIGDTITAEVTVERVINESKGIVRLNTAAYNQEKRIVIKGYAVVKTGNLCDGRHREQIGQFRFAD